MPIRDADIRKALYADLLEQYVDDADTRIIHELGICQGYARVDLAVINGELRGFEIKSEQDTLERLPRQQEVYSQVFDRVTVVVYGNHSGKVFDHIPDWWEVVEVRLASHNHLVFHTLRSGKENPHIDTYSLVQLLWRDEAYSLLKRYGMARGMSNRSRQFMWRRLSTSLPIDELKECVRTTLKERSNWRVDRQQKSDDVTPQQISILEDCPDLH